MTAAAPILRERISLRFENLMRYSPLHNVRAGAKYPATLVLTADHDDRVVPSHSKKFVAAPQAAQAGPAPIMIRVTPDQGHGRSSLGLRLEEAKDIWAFLMKALRPRRAQAGK